VVEKGLAEGISLHSTIRRRLGDEANTTFRDVVRKRREVIAEQLLRDPRVTITEVSQLLGDANPSNFVRAFASWKGGSPKEYRVGVAASEFPRSEPADTPY
jgi:AraC-like DNA-binding protein